MQAQDRPSSIIVTIPGASTPARMLPRDEDPWRDAADRAVRRLTGCRATVRWAGWRPETWAADGSAIVYRATFVSYPRRDGGSPVIAEASAKLYWD